MNRLLASALLLSACHGGVTRDPLAVKPSALPATLESCGVLGEEKDGRRCAVYDTQKRAFSEQPDGTREDALARRAFLYERWLELYNSPEKQVAVRGLTEAMAPGTPESRFGDPAYLKSWEDEGDSAGFSDTALQAALFHYAVTGAEADYQRMEAWVRGMVMQWDATGMDGYLARWHFAAVPGSTPRRNDRAYGFRDPKDLETYDIPATALDKMPAWYRDPGVTPSWQGHTSIDAYSGSMNAWPLAARLLRDSGLKARMARHYGCFLKRLRIFKIVNLSKNVQLQADLAHYLTSVTLQLDPGDPDLTKVDQVWGFYLPQFNHASAPGYPRECPARLSIDASAAETIDAGRSGFELQLLEIIGRQRPDDNSANSIDFAYFPSIRAGDAAMLEAYALGAYHLSGDEEFLHWRDQVLVQKANAREISKTVGAFNPPRPCRSYYRTPNVYDAHFMRTLIERDDSFDKLLWRNKFRAREVLGLRDVLFESMYAGATGDAPAPIIGDLYDLGGAKGHLDDPRRNYAVTLPGAAPATAEELRVCSQPITVLGFRLPIDPPDPNAPFVLTAPPVGDRPPDNWLWEDDPFAGARTPGDAGQQQYTGLDLLEPYWIARYYGLLPDPHLVLAWKR